MEVIAGQTDIFAALDQPVPAPPFTIYTCVWAEKGCGWCHAGGLDGGGACRNPNNKDESFFYSYCRPCREKYGYPKVAREGFALNIDRTQRRRPSADPKQEKGCPP